MAKENDPWRRFREREDEQEEEDRLTKQNQPDSQSTKGVPNVLASAEDALASGGDSDKVIELIRRCEPLIDQVHSLYNQYFAGAERRPPLERRKQLDQVMTTLHMIAKPTPALRFRCNALYNQYVTYRDRWEKLLKDFETGKIRRPNAKR